MAPGARIERDLETPRCSTRSAASTRRAAARRTTGVPVRGLSISGSIVTVRDVAKPAVVARGPLVGARLARRRPAAALRRQRPRRHPPAAGAGRRRARPRRSGRRATTRPWRRARRCRSASASLGAALPDGRHTVSVEATDTAGNVTRVDRAVAVDRNAPALSFVPSSGGRGASRVDAVDAGHRRDRPGRSRPAARGQRTFRPLRTSLRGSRLVARLARGSRTSTTLRATATDAARAPRHAHRRAGAHARRLRRAAWALGQHVARRRVVVHGRLRAAAPGRCEARRSGRPAAARGRRGAGRGRRPVRTAPRGRFRVALRPGAAASLRVTSPGTGGLQARLRTLRLHVPWSSSLTVRPRAPRRGGAIRAVRPPAAPWLRRCRRRASVVELQAFDRGRWRVFATTRARAAPAPSWQHELPLRLAARHLPHPGAHPARGHDPYELGYSRPVRVTVR